MKQSSRGLKGRSSIFWRTWLGGVKRHRPGSGHRALRRYAPQSDKPTENL